MSAANNVAQEKAGYKPTLTLFNKARNVLTKVIHTLVYAKVKVEIEKFRSMSDEDKMRILRKTKGALEKQSLHKSLSHSIEKLLGSRSNANTLDSNRGKKGIETYYKILKASIDDEITGMLSVEKFENCNSDSFLCRNPKDMTIYYIHNGNLYTNSYTLGARDLDMENSFDTTGYKNFQNALISWLNHLKITHHGKYKDISEKIDIIIEIISDSESERHKMLQEEGGDSSRTEGGGTRRTTLRRKRKAGRAHRN
jgi:hypothetical protein